MPELGSYRGEFPILRDRAYLASHSLGPLSQRGRAAAQEHLELWERLGPEELWMEHGLPKLERCRELFAELIGAGPDEVAIVPSVSAGLSSIATCLDLQARPKVVLSEMDFPTNHYVWRAQEKAGAKLDVVGSPDGIRIHGEDLAARVDEQTSVVNLNRVLFESSFIVDATPVVRAAREHGALTVVDDFHGVGIVPLEVHELGVDLLVAGALKWLCGGQGLAFLYCRRELLEELEPRVVGWFGTKDPFDFDRGGLRLRDDARRFETGTFTLPQAWTAVAGLELIAEARVERIRAHNRTLSRIVIEGADELGLEVLSPREDEDRGGLVRMRIPGGREGAERVLHDLLDRDVVVDSRSDTLRVSAHLFNDESDVERFLAELKAAL